MKPGPSLSTSAGDIRASVFADLAPRIEAFTRAGGELIALHIGDTCIAPPAPARFRLVADEASLSVDPLLYRYGSISGMAAVREACAESLRRTGRARPGLDAQRHLLLGVGATHALFCAARAALEPGDEVLIASPYWPLSVGVLRAAGGIPIEVPLTDRLYREPGLDAGAAFEAALTPRTKALYVITPNNPDGKVLGTAHLESIARLARARNLWVIADEVYADYTYDVPHVSMATLADMEHRTISAYSFSKSHALAGARVGFAVAPEALVAVAQRVSTHTVFNVPVISQRLVLAALGAGGSWVDAARDEYRGARDLAAKALEGSGVRFSLAEGGTYLFLDFSAVLGDAPLSRLLERAIDHGVLLAPGDAFGKGFEKWARLCFTSVPRATLLEGIARLRKAIEEMA